ncbi:MAG TPA: poly-beta-1,6-N-acetyl-D-glucosamine biosynthesis protein PgaD [Alphaproteobacteria bacterium]|nr:poly-beta-1,6-N-acetyl-D-glucosamine biosynthesis protein PgaD [Alphaproteobacteria bacterium]
MKEPIIREGASRPLYLRLIDIVMTLLIWASYIYLLRGVFLFIASSAEDIAHGSKISLGSGIVAVGRSLGSYVEVIAVNSAIFIAWALYNQLMYGGRNRRKSADPVKAAEIGAFFGLTGAQVDECRQARRLVVTHDKAGAILEYQVSSITKGD